MHRLDSEFSLRAIIFVPDIGGPPVSDWVKHMELSKASQIEQSKRQADMVTASFI